MSEQPTGEAARDKALHILVRVSGLTPEEVSQLRLNHLRLAGKNPSISFTSSEHARPRTIELDLEAHRALVSWLVVRPDAISDFLFPGEGAEPLAPAAIQRAANEVEATQPPPPAASGGTGQRTTPLKPTPAAGPPAGERGPAPASTMPKPPPVRPGPPPPRPPSAPEAGAPPLGFETRRLHPFPPSTAPEADEVRGPAGAPPSGPASRPVPAQPLPPPPESEERPAQPFASRPNQETGTVRPKVGRELKPAPKPLEKKAPVRVPPKAVRKKETSQDPVLMQSKETEASPPQAPLEAVEPDSSEAPAALAENQPLSPEPAVSEMSLETKAPALHSEAVTPHQEILQASEEVVPRRSPATAKPAQPARQPGRKPAAQPEIVRPALFSFALGGFVGILLLCLVCMGGSGWLFFQTETGNQLMSSLGLTGLGLGETQLAEATDELAEFATEESSSTFESPVGAAISPLATPTLPPTDTPTPLPATDTPVPTNTPAAALPTDTPPPTDTPVPTATPTPEPPAQTPTPAEPPSPAPTPTSGFKYEAPILIGPKNDFKFIGNNQIVFRWQPVDLATDEQYAVRVRYQYNNQIVYQGAQVKEPQWEMPNALYLQIDPPLHRYEWFVVIERLNDDGSGTAISPQSEVRTFIWD